MYETTVGTVYTTARDRPYGSNLHSQYQRINNVPAVPIQSRMNAKRDADRQNVKVRYVSIKIHFRYG